METPQSPSGASVLPAGIATGSTLPAADQRPGSAAAPTLFISDLHLSAAQPMLRERFERFLLGPARTARALYILGDLFDHWIGDDDVANAFNESVLASLAALVAHGVPVSFLPGNRDFLCGSGAARRAQWRALDQPVAIALGSATALILHGDTLCTDDHAYQRYRSMIQNRIVTTMLLALPLRVRRAIAQSLRARSRDRGAAMSGPLGDVSEAAVAAAFRASSLQLMIHGHTHRPGCHTVEIDGRPCVRWVLPDWRADRGGYLRCDDSGGIALVEFL